MIIDSIYEPTTQAEEVARTVKLRAVEWKLLLSIGQLKGITIRQMASELQIGFEAAAAGIQRLMEFNLIHDPETPWAQFAARFPALIPPYPESVPAVHRNGNAEPAAASPVRMTIKRTPGVSVKRAGTMVAEPIQLKPVLDFVRQRSGGGSLGQMAVYRVFLKISPELLKQSGLETVNLDDESVVVENSALIQELLQSVKEVVGEPFFAQGS